MNKISAPSETRARLQDASPWWKGAAIYQIYPRSFQDSNGDGVGDLPGITRRLDHVAALGVDAIWISPFFKSPMKDFGYDVADYRDVDPLFGTLADFDALVDRAHALGLKVLIDQVYSHTSDEHPWFAESRSSRDNSKADWYVWADPKPDGSPPNNWQSVFGGPAWTWDARRGQYYLHNFLASQPQLNGHNPEVQEALLAVARFWLDRGVDGFRLDALNFAMHDPQLRDNPPAPPTNRRRSRPFDFQIKKYNQSHPDIIGFVEKIRALTDRYDAIFTVAEVGGDHADAEMKAFTHGERRLNSAYGFDFLYADKLTGALVKSALEQWREGEGWPSWAFENHDAPRAASRWWDARHREAAKRMKAALLCMLRGNIILYYGEELGLEQVEIPYEQLRDPEALANWPLTLSRDGARTPMPWERDAPHCGFSSVEPWLPIGEDNAARALGQQIGRADSLLELTRRLLRFRREEPALREGRLAECTVKGELLIIERALGGRRIRAFINLGEGAIALEPAPSRTKTLIAINAASGDHLPPFGVLICET